MTDVEIFTFKGTAKSITVDSDIICPDCDAYINEDGEGHSSWCIHY